MGKKLDVALTSAEQAPWFARTGIGANPDFFDVAYGNNFTQKWKNAAGTGDVLGVGVDTSNNLTVGGAVVTPFRQSISFPIPINAGAVDQCVFIVPYAMTISGITEIHA